MEYVVEELLGNLVESDCAHWHKFDRQWMIFDKLVSIAGARGSKVAVIMEKVVRAKAATSIHVPCLDLARLLETVPYNVLIPAVRG
jgi:hypothetical protein